MKIEDIEVNVIVGEHTSTIITKEILKLYDNNASKILNIPSMISKKDKYQETFFENL